MFINDFVQARICLSFLATGLIMSLARITCTVTCDEFLEKMGFEKPAYQVLFEY